MQEYIGKFNTPNPRVAIVVSRFNEMITRGLLAGAIDALERQGHDTEELQIVWVPGAFEIGVVAKRLALSGKYEAVVCLGAVVRGSTPHFDYVAAQAASAIASAALETQIPIIFGVLTVETLEQGFERAGTRMGNKGFESMQAALEMIDLLRQLGQQGLQNMKKNGTVSRRTAQILTGK